MEELRKIYFLTYYQMRSRYRKTIAGFFWVIANPIVTFFVQALIFKNVLRFEIANYPLFLLSGLLPWFFISQSLNISASSLVQSRELLLSLKISPSTIIGAQILDQFINFLAAFFILLIFQLSYINTSLLVGFLTVINLVVVLIFIFFLANLIAFWHVFYRDTQFVLQFVLGIVYFVTPIFYPINLIPIEYQWLVWVNPFYPFIQLFQTTLFSFSLDIYLLSLLKSTGFIIATGLLYKISIKNKMRDFYINI